MLHENSLVWTVCLWWCARTPSAQRGPRVSGIISRRDLSETEGLYQGKHGINRRISSSPFVNPFWIIFIRFLTVCFHFSFFIHSQFCIRLGFFSFLFVITSTNFTNLRSCMCNSQFFGSGGGREGCLA